MDEQRVYWLALTRVKGIGAARFKDLLDAFGDARSAWAASPSQPRAAGMPDGVVEGHLQLRESLDFELMLQELKEHEVSVLTWEDETYPRRLREIDFSPPVLYVKGELIPEDEWAVAVVGTRRFTKYGRQVAEELGAYLAGQGITVVSGLAKGVDALAQEAALEAGGRSLAIMGHGLHQIYPAGNRPLAERLVQRGALISDYGIGVPPDGANFPARNRIISGLSIAVIVVEAGHKSGALITARFAAEQGRDVFAVPGNMFAPQSKGTNRLIRDGAHPLLNYDQILETLDLEYMSQQKSARVVLPEDATEAKLFEILTREPMHVDEIGALSELPIDQVSSTLALMELKGMVRQVGGMNYVAVRELGADYRVDADISG